MGFKKPLFSLLPSVLYPTSKCCCANGPASHSQSYSTITRPPSDAKKRPQRPRSYATISHPEPASDPHLHWPTSLQPSMPPSPYQIFNQKKGEPYSKHRFYELVKLYHPDRNTSLDDSTETLNPCKCPRSVMLERYRLIIAANTILSDPLKREAYDRYGYGWGAYAGDDPAHAGGGVYKYTTQHRWRAENAGTYHWPVDQDIMYNATWEDWERWYEQQARARSPRSKKSSSWTPSFFSHRPNHHTVFFNNYAFASVIFLLAALGGIGQATRVSGESKSRLERAQLASDETNKLLIRARQDARDQSDGGETKDQRIRRFLREKEVYNEGEFDGRVLREGDDGLCASGIVKEKGAPRFWQKPPEQ